MRHGGRLSLEPGFVGTRNPSGFARRSPRCRPRTRSLVLMELTSYLNIRHRDASPASGRPVRRPRCQGEPTSRVENTCRSRPLVYNAHAGSSVRAVDPIDLADHEGSSACVPIADFDPHGSRLTPWRFSRLLAAGVLWSCYQRACPSRRACQSELGRVRSVQPGLVQPGRRARASTGGVGWINSGPITLDRAPGQDRPARFLDLLLHQLPPRPARPGQARGEVQERAGRHRRAHRQVRRRARHREHPPQGRRVPDQAPGRQRRQPGHLEAVRRQ